MHNTCTIFCKLKHFNLPPLTHSSPAPTEVSPRRPCLKEAKNLQQLLVFPQQMTEEENAQIEKVKSATYSYSRCVMCVCVCVCKCLSACVCIVYTSACKQCCRLCSNSILFKVYDEKFRAATYITVFDGFAILRKIFINI